MTGVHALQRIMALVFEREKTGQGGTTTIQVSLFDTALGCSATILQTYWERGRFSRKKENAARATSRSVPIRRSRPPMAR